MISRMIYYARWYLAALFGRRRPILATVVLHHLCNLHCSHCSLGVDDVSTPSASSAKLAENPPLPELLTPPESPPVPALSYRKISTWMEDAFRRGARMIFFEGGEPLLWRDGSYSLADLIHRARVIGYFYIAYTTNGTLPIVPEADLISFSLDGPEAVHDAIRGVGSFKALHRNLDNLVSSFGGAKPPVLFANATISEENASCLRELVDTVGTFPGYPSLMINIVTPPTAAPRLSPPERRSLVAQIRRIRREMRIRNIFRGSRATHILNSSAGLADLVRSDYSARCPRWMSLFLIPATCLADSDVATGTDQSSALPESAGEERWGCPLSGINDPAGLADPGSASCRECGFAAPREWKQMLGGKIFSALRLLRIFGL